MIIILYFYELLELRTRRMLSQSAGSPENSTNAVLTVVNI